MYTIELAHNSRPPKGAKMTPRTKKIGRTVFGVRMGLVAQAIGSAGGQMGLSQRSMLLTAMPLNVVDEKQYLIWISIGATREPYCRSVPTWWSS